MVAPVFHKIVQGETLRFELRFVGEVLTGATVRVETSAGMSPADFSTSIIETDTVEVLATSTQNFATGVHDFRVWLEWPDDTEEVGLAGLIHVTQRLDFWDAGTGVIDGGVPDTEHEDLVDGGPA